MNSETLAFFLVAVSRGTCDAHIRRSIYIVSYIVTLASAARGHSTRPAAGNDVDIKRNYVGV